MTQRRHCVGHYDERARPDRPPGRNRAHRPRPAESEKFVAEQRKLISQSRKLDRDRWLAPLVLLGSLGAASSSPFSAHLWK